MTRKHTHQAGAAPRVPQTAECPCPAKPSKKRSGESPLTRSHPRNQATDAAGAVGYGGHLPTAPVGETSGSLAGRGRPGGET